MKIKHWLTSLAAAIIFSACDGEDLKLYYPDDTCAAINGARFYSETLELGGFPLDGPSYMHWKLSFDDGYVLIHQEDTGMLANYYCDDNNVAYAVLPESTEIPLNFSLDYSTLTFNLPDEKTLTYVRDDDAIRNTQPCQTVRGNVYTGQNLSLSFVSHQGVTISEAGVETQGIYDCSFGEVRVYTSADDTSPMTVSISADENTLEVNNDGHTVVLEKSSTIVVPPLPPIDPPQPFVCPDLYEPICGEVTSSTQCITAPCPTTVEYKTFSNACYAEQEGARVAYTGECQTSPTGKPPEPSPIPEPPFACLQVFEPVCATVTLEDSSLEYKTFSNDCEAAVAGATVVSLGQCRHSSL